MVAVVYVLPADTLPRGMDSILDVKINLVALVFAKNGGGGSSCILPNSLAHSLELKAGGMETTVTNLSGVEIYQSQWM